MKKYILVVILGFLVIGGIAYYLTTQNKKQDTFAPDYLAKADEYYEDKQYSNALEQYKHAINADPSNTDAYQKAAEIYILKSKYDEAIQLLQNGETSASRADMIQHKIGQILFEKNDIEGALSYFEQANLTNRNNWANAVDLVKAYSYYPDKKEKSLESLNNVETSDDEGYVYTNYYLALISYENAGTAVTYLESASQKAQGDIKENIDQYLQVARKAQTDPEDIVQNNTLIAYELIRGELYPTAIPLLDTAISENDEYYAAYMYKGICYMKMNDLENARDNLEKATTVEPNEIQPHLFLAQAYTLQNNQQQAIDTYQNALNIDKSNEKTRYDLAKTLLLFELFRQARLEYLELIELNTSQVILYKVELAYLDLDRLENLEEGLNLAKEVVEDWEGFQNAEIELKAKALDVLGWAYEKNGQKDEALKYLKRSIETYTYFASAYYHLGLIYAEIENYSEATLNFERAIDLDLTGEISAKASSELEKLSRPQSEEEENL